MAVAMRTLDFAGSSVGKKVLMAVTGLVLFGFVVGHLAGNLLIFAGPGALNAYGKKLLDLGPLLWAARLFLLANLVAHVGLAVALVRENRRARPVAYKSRSWRESSYAARTMMLSGVIVFAFIVYHLLHFTFRVTHPELAHLTDAAGRHDIYSMVVLSFRRPLLAGAYIAAMFLLALHLSHGLASLMQSLGLNRDGTKDCFKKAGALAAALVFLGYSAIPAAVLAGVVKLPAGVLP
jgi:succinate dehydrogenase / fumarate reductase cytochrome b subunit